MKEGNVGMTFKERIGCLLVACAVGSFILTCIVLLVNICQVVIPWMKTGQWGEFSTVEDITGKLEVSDDAWHIKRIVAVAIGEIPACFLFLALAFAIFGFSWVTRILDD